MARYSHPQENPTLCLGPRCFVSKTPTCPQCLAIKTPTRTCGALEAEVPHRCGPACSGVGSRGVQGVGVEQGVGVGGGDGV